MDYVDKLTVENHNTENGQVEEYAWPRGSVDHGEDDGDDEGDHFNEKRPDNATRHVRTKKTQLWLILVNSSVV